MKNVKNIMFIFAIIAFLFIAHTSYASQINPTEETEVLTIAIDPSTYDPEKEYEGIDPNGYNPHRTTAQYIDTHIDEEGIARFVTPLYGALMWIAIIAAVISLSVIGLKFIAGSASEKAEYKQHLIPFAVGIAVIAFLFVILRILAQMAESFY